LVPQIIVGWNQVHLGPTRQLVGPEGRAMCLQAIQTMLPNLIGNPATGITQFVGSLRSHSGVKSSTHIVYGPPEMRSKIKKGERFFTGSIQ
jgi:hypothetical protein